jgi:hypothetical protein
VGRHLLYFPIENGGVGVRHPAVQAGTFRTVFIHKILKANDFYFNDFSSKNILNILLKNECLFVTPFFSNMTFLTNTIGMTFMSLSPENLHKVTLSNAVFFNHQTFPFLIKSGFNTVGDFISNYGNTSSQVSRLPSRRKVESEVNTLNKIIGSTNVVDPPSLCCLGFRSEEKESITEATLYLMHTPLIGNISWSLVALDSMNDCCWEQLKRGEVSNPEKDVVYKIWHNVGLTPKLAESMGLRLGRDCPFCNSKEIKSSHFPFCDKFKPLWEYVFKILGKSWSISSLRLISRGCSDDI